MQANSISSRAEAGSLPGGPSLENRRTAVPCSPAAAVLARLTDFTSLTKQRVTVLVVITAWLGYALGAAGLPAAAKPGWLGWLVTLTGTGLACMGAAALNQVIERGPDSRMQRTRSRPIPAGRLSARNGTLLGLALSAAGVGVLAIAGHLVAAMVCLVTILLYVMVYTPMKRVHWSATLIGAVPGALPPVIGYAVATGTIGPAAWAVFALMFAWQMPHFMAIAWLYRDDYARGGFPFLAVVDPSGRSTFRQMLLWAAALLPIGAAPWWLGFAGPFYLLGASVAGMAFLLLALMLVNHRSLLMARATFYASLIYLPVVLVLMVADHV